MVTSLLGREVKFIPAFLRCDNDGGRLKFDAKLIRGVVTQVNEEHGWFMVTYRVGSGELRECCKECEIGKEVTLLGHKKNC